MASTNPPDFIAPLQSLYDACKLVEEELHTASQQMQNRGQKYLLKRFAQRHLGIANRLDDLARRLGFTLTHPGRFRYSLRRGWMDIQVAMIVPRVNRQAVAAAKCAEAEALLFRKYDEVLQLPLPEPARTEIRAQSDAVLKMHRWLQRIAHQDEWIIRLYEDAGEATNAVQQLRNDGFGEEQIEVTPLNQVVLYPGDAAERGRSTVDAALVMALIVGAFGLGMGLLMGYFLPTYAPDWPAAQVPMWLSLLVWGLLGIAVGALFGALIGVLIGRGLAEDDAELMAATAGAAVIVVSVRTTDANHAAAARILEMRHQRELETGSGVTPMTTPANR